MGERLYFSFPFHLDNTSSQWSRMNLYTFM